MATSPIVIDPNAGDINVDDLTGLIPAVGPSAPGIITAEGVASAVAGIQTPAPASTGVSPWLWIVLIGAGLLFLDSTTGKR